MRTITFLLLAASVALWSCSQPEATRAGNEAKQAAADTASAVHTLASGAGLAKARDEAHQAAVDSGAAVRKGVAETRQALRSAGDDIKKAGGDKGDKKAGA